MDELMHYGIKGQKWGVRRFQNADGSYTAAGKRRSQKQTKEAEKSKIQLTEKQKQYCKAVAAAAGAALVASAGFKLGNSSKLNELVEKAKETNLAADQKKKPSVKDMSNEDLTESVRRLALEKQYKNLTKQSETPSGLESTKKAVDATSELVRQAKKLDQDSGKAAEKERLDLSKKTDKELREEISRELLERQYNNLFAKPETVSKGRQYLSDVLDNAGTVLAVGSSALSIALAIQQLQKK